MRDPKRTGFRILFHACALFPLIWLLWDLAQGNLTADPIRAIQLRTGRYTLTILVLSLACTPLYRFLGIRPALQLRRPLGLYAFAYASLHFLNLIAIDYGFNITFLRQDLPDKRYILVGFAAYLILLALAITSTQGWQRRLGKGWKRLHRFVYAAALLAIVHFLWQVKADGRAPLIYGGVVVLLLAMRLLVLRRIASEHFGWLHGLPLDEN